LNSNQEKPAAAALFSRTSWSQNENNHLEDGTDVVVEGDSLGGANLVGLSACTSAEVCALASSKRRSTEERFRSVREWDEHIEQNHVCVTPTAEQLCAEPQGTEAEEEAEIKKVGAENEIDAHGDSLLVPDAQLDRRRPGVREKNGFVPLRSASVEISRTERGLAGGDEEDVAMVPVRMSVDISSGGSAMSRSREKSLQAGALSPDHSSKLYDLEVPLSEQDSATRTQSAGERPRTSNAEQRGGTFGSFLRMKSDLSRSKEGSTKNTSFRASSRGTSFTLGSLQAFVKRSSTDRASGEKQPHASTESNRLGKEDIVSSTREVLPSAKNELQDTGDVVEWDPRNLDSVFVPLPSEDSSEASARSEREEDRVGDGLCASESKYIIARSGSLIDLDVAGRTAAPVVQRESKTATTEQPLSEAARVLVGATTASSTENANASSTLDAVAQSRSEIPRSSSQYASSQRASVTESSVGLETAATEPSITPPTKLSSTPGLSKNKKQGALTKKIRSAVATVLKPRPGQEENGPTKSDSQIDEVSHTALNDVELSAESAPVDMDLKGKKPPSRSQSGKWRERLRSASIKRSVSKAE